MRGLVWFVRSSGWSIVVWACASGCAKPEKSSPGSAIPPSPTVQGGAGTAGAAPLGPPPAPGSGGSTGVVTVPTGGSSGGGSVCTPVSCEQLGGTYCGKVGNGCGAALECGACSDDFSCEKGVCVGGPSCEKLECETPGGRYCGTVGDGCGRSVDCGACPGDEDCVGGVCVAANCVPLTCDGSGTSFCGEIGDGCGATIDCGECTAPATCGGGGIDNVCGDPDCEPIECETAEGGEYCGLVGDGCGGQLDCDECSDGSACGSGGVPSVCPFDPCEGLECDVEKCPSGKTSLSGVVYDPSGTLPLYNVLVYIPNAELEPIVEGATCVQCDAVPSGDPITTALTDTEGRFTLEGVPTGSDIPLVMQIGKWRRQVTIPSTISCADTMITDPELTRLPRNQGEGNIPKIALTTGNYDALECLLRKIGISDEEFTTDAGDGRVHLFVGGENESGASAFNAALGGEPLPDADTLWSSSEKMAGYDILVLSCEGPGVTDKSPYIPNMEAYADAGGRVFADHMHFPWLQSGSAAFSGTATYIGVGADFPLTTSAKIDTSFPKGQALSDWLVAVQATPTPNELTIHGAQHSVTAVTPPTQRWIYVEQNPNEENLPGIQYMTFNTPVAAMPADQCGRVVFTDIHINGVPDGVLKDVSEDETPFPDGCTTEPLTPQAKALVFMFFDLSSCVQPDQEPPQPPAPPPPPDVPPPPIAGPPPPPPPPPPPAPPPPVP